MSDIDRLSPNTGRLYREQGDNSFTRQTRVVRN